LKIKLGNGLGLVATLSLSLAILVVLPPIPIIRQVIAVTFLLLVPGFTTSLALFPACWPLKGIERLSLSLGISFVVVPLLGLAAAHSPLGFTLEKVAILNLSYVIIIALVALLRLRKLPKIERFNINIKLKIYEKGTSHLDKYLSILFVFILFVSFASFIYLLSMQSKTEKFTEFYIIDINGVTGDYPRVMKVEQESTLTLVIVSHEGRETHYRIEIYLNNDKIRKIDDVRLDNGQKWEETITITPTNRGEGQQLKLMLFKDDDSEPALNPLWLNINVV
jgi:uncharacterized membrane protein